CLDALLPSPFAVHSCKAWPRMDTRISELPHERAHQELLDIWRRRPCLKWLKDGFIVVAQWNPIDAGKRPIEETLQRLGIRRCQPGPDRRKLNFCSITRRQNTAGKPN